MSDKSTAKQATITAITAADTHDVATFLHHHMNDQFTPEVWQRGISKSWLADTPNHGFMLIYDAQVVGVLCAIYSEQYVSGELKPFCNPHSWCVLPDFRTRSVDLVLAVIRQKGFDFTMLSPNSEGIEIFKFLRFKPLDNNVSILLNIPSVGFTTKVKIVEDLTQAQNLLPEQSAKYFADHTEFPWLNLLTFGVNDQYGFMVFKQQKYKRLASAWVLYVSNAALFRQCWPALRTHLLFKHGMFSSKIETRLLDQPIKTWLKPEEGAQKFFLSSDLSADSIHNIYSELITLDL